MIYRRFGKRTLDALVSIAALLVLAPILVVIAALVRFTLGSPILFRQTRTGLHRRCFEILKFRTMTSERDAEGKLLDAVHRLTPLGRWLRSTSLDELPELWNVLKGEMSLVGPRPLLPRYLPLYSEWQQRRDDVRPGITGWAQINGRNSISWGEKFELDVWYVDHVSARLDITIIWRTLAKVFKREGINASETVTMPPFDGTN